MIVKLHDSVEGILYAIPALREFAIRRPDDLLLVETRYPTLLHGLEELADVDLRIEDHQEVVRLDEVSCSKYNGHFMDAYAIALLGDTRLSCRRLQMNVDVTIKKRAEETREALAEKVAVVCLNDSPKADEVSQRLRDAGYETLGVLLEPKDAPYMKALVDLCDLFVGVDGASSAIAAATEVPMVVCHSWRSPRHTRPFRRGAPYEAVVPIEKCVLSENCFTAHAKGEFGNVYHVQCPSDDRFVCRQLDVDAIWAAIQKVTAECASKSS
jgi:hypothetical protein